MTRYADVIVRRWRVVALISAASALAASITYLGVRPRTYEATATVLVPVPSGASSVIMATAQAVADLQAALETRAIAERVASNLDLSIGEVAGALDTRRVGSGGVVEIRARGHVPSTVEVIAVEAGREALALFAEARLAPYARRLAIAQQTFDEANQAVQGFLERFGSIQPWDEFDRVAALLSELRARADEARASGDHERADILEARIASLTERWSPLIVEWQALSAVRSQAQRDLGAAQVDYAAARASLEAATEGAGAVTGSRATPVPRTRVFLRSVVPIVVLATALGIVLVVWLEIAGPQGGWTGSAGPAKLGAGGARGDRSARNRSDLEHPG